MTNTSNTTETRRPAKLSPPSDRDLEIFQHAQIHRRTHLDIADDFGVTRRRVGQIVHDVRHWLSLHGTDDPVLYSQIQRQRLDRAMERIYLKDIIHRAVHALNNAPLTLTTSTHVNNHCVKEVKREQPPVDSRLLKTYLQAVNSLGKLNQRQPLELPAQPWKHPHIQAVVDDWSEKNKDYSLDPEEFDQFAQELTTTIQSCLDQGSPPTPSGTEAEHGLDSEDIHTTAPLPPHPDLDLDPDLDPPPSAPSALPSASLPSLPEALPTDPITTRETAPSPCPPTTSENCSRADSTTTATPASLQNPEKGSAPPPGSGVVCGEDSPLRTNEPPQSTPDPFTSPSSEYSEA